MTGPAAERYLRLLGVPRRAPSLVALTELTSAHLWRVPFENISKLRDRHRTDHRRPPDLDRFLDGIEHARLGATCYGSAFNFHQLLGHLGYDVRLCAGDMNEPGMHLVNVVVVDGRPYLVDVGFAAPFLDPLPLDASVDQVVEWGNELHVLAPPDAAGRSVMSAYRDGVATQGYSLTLEPRGIEDFSTVIARSFLDGASFMHRIVVARFDRGRSLTLRNLTLTEIASGRTTITKIPGVEELPEVVEAAFDIPRDVTGEALESLVLT